MDSCGLRGNAEQTLLSGLVCSHPKAETLHWCRDQDSPSKMANGEMFSKLTSYLGGGGATAYKADPERSKGEPSEARSLSEIEDEAMQP